MFLEKFPYRVKFYTKDNQMSDSQTLGGFLLPASCFRLSVSGFPLPVARHYGVRMMCRLCSYISPAQKSSAGLLPFKGRGPWLFVTQH